MFCGNPFPLFNAIGDLIDGTQATGHSVFQAGQTSTFDHHDSPAHKNTPDSIDSKIDPVLLDLSWNKDKDLSLVCPFQVQRNLIDYQ